jgi:hypothetical protein
MPRYKSRVYSPGSGFVFGFFSLFGKLGEGYRPGEIVSLKVIAMP